MAEPLIQSLLEEVLPTPIMKIPISRLKLLLMK